MGTSRVRQVYTVDDVADVLGIARSTAYDLIYRREIASVRLGRKIVVTRPTLTKILGFAPPLPAELDDLRKAEPTPPTPSRKLRAVRNEPSSRHIG